MRHLAPVFAPTTDPVLEAERLRLEVLWGSCPHAEGFDTPGDAFIRNIEMCRTCGMPRPREGQRAGKVCTHVRMELDVFSSAGKAETVFSAWLVSHLVDEEEQ